MFHLTHTAMLFLMQTIFEGELSGWKKLVTCLKQENMDDVDL